MVSDSTHPTTAWWKEAVVYQIYPSSYLDTTGSGSGDLNGITLKLPYIKSLGVDIVWISPIYASPMNDMGYDISDYRAINPRLGTMADWERLIARAHELGLKLVMDLVVNHTSSEHAWFKESVKGGEKRDWYLWRPGKKVEDGSIKMPNNWGAMFGGSVWEKDPSPRTDEYYLHTFDVTQPDLNWGNPAVREAVWDIMKFWLDKGCDGFRMDVINCISKEPGFPDAEILNPDDEFQGGLQHRFSGPSLKTWLDEMHDRVLQHYPGAFTVGETPGIDTPERGLELLKGGKPLQMIFNFEHMFVDIVRGEKAFVHGPWKLSQLKKILGGWMSHMQANDGWDSLYVENHDQPRILQRWASSTLEFRREAAKMLAIFHATGRGTLFLYQGQEIGTANSPAWSFDELRDVEEINYYNEKEKKRGKGADMSDVLRGIQAGGRDNARMGMQWDDSANGGFTTGKPWIKTNEEYKEVNVKKQEGDPESVLHFWKRLLKLRKEHRTLVYGWFEMVDGENEDVYAYTRTKDGMEYLVVCNFKGYEVEWKTREPRGEFLIGSHGGRNEESSDFVKLRPYEGRIYLHQGQNEKEG